VALGARETELMTDDITIPQGPAATPTEMNWTARDHELLADAPYAQTSMLEGIPDQGCSSYVFIASST